MWAENNNRAVKFFTARPNGILRGGVGSQNRYLYSVIACGPVHLPSFLNHPGRPSRGVPKATDMLLRIFQMP